MKEKERKTLILAREISFNPGNLMKNPGGWKGAERAVCCGAERSERKRFEGTQVRYRQHIHQFVFFQAPQQTF